MPERRELKKLRAIALGYPEVTERVSHGSPNFVVRNKKSFVWFIDGHHGEAGISLWCKAADGVQAELITQEPERFFKPPYLGPSGWLGLRLDVDLDWDEVESVVDDAYRLVAPKKLIALLPERDEP